MKEKFIVVEWPEIQELQEHEDFLDNAYPILDDKGIADYGGSAYFVKEIWYNSIKQ